MKWPFSLILFVRKKEEVKEAKIESHGVFKKIWKGRTVHVIDAIEYFEDW